MFTTEKIISLISNRYLELIILPTEQCNFRCTYCYEDFNLGKMQPNVVQAIKSFLNQRVPELDILKISWFGGEPLAAKNIVYEISEHILNLNEKYPSLQYVSAMTTNGFMLQEVTFQKLISLGIKYFQISLDGTEEIHNQTRKRISGAATFATIWKNLLKMRDSGLDFEIIIRIHLTPKNLEDIYLLIDQLKTNFMYDNRFNIFLKTIENLGGPNSGTFETLRHASKKEILQQFNTYLAPELTAKKMTANGPYVCYAAQSNSFVIRADGKIGKCTVAFHDDRNTLGALQSDGTIRIDHDKLHLWTRGIKTLDAKTLYCPAAHLPALKTKSQSIPIIVK